MAEALNAEVAEISGTVERITYKNQNNGYTVAEVKLPGESITVVGILPFLTEGDCAVFYGSYTVHPTYGRQFKAESFERKTPENAAAVLRYLSSGAIKGVGPATAQTMLTTLVSFASLALTPGQGVREFSIAGAIGSSYTPAARATTAPSGAAARASAIVLKGASFEPVEGPPAKATST